MQNQTEHCKNSIKYILYTLIQITWGIPQTIIGLFLFFYCILNGCKAHFVRGMIGVGWHRNDGISLGLFFFCPSKDFNSNGIFGILSHEYGHTVQSLLLGPLYLLLIMIPSLFWCGLPYFRKYRIRTGTSYSKLWCEHWADYIGNKMFKLNK